MKKFYVLLVLILLVMTPLSIWALYYGNPQWSKYVYIWQLERLHEERKSYFTNDSIVTYYMGPYTFEDEYMRWEYKDGQAYAGALYLPVDGEFSGMWKCWTPEGRLLGEFEYEKGVQTKFVGYTSEGEISCVYRRRVYQGQSELYGENLKYKDGKLYVRFDYTGNHTRYVQIFYENGVVKQEYLRKNRNVQGYMICRSENGELSRLVWFYGVSKFRKTLFDRDKGLDRRNDLAGLFVSDESWRFMRNHLTRNEGPNISLEFHGEVGQSGELKTITFLNEEKNVSYEYKKENYESTIQVEGDLVYQHFTLSHPNDLQGIKRKTIVDKRSEYKELLEPAESLTVPLPMDLQE